MLSIRKKDVYEKYDSELKLPPVLNVQVWDNDTFSPDDFLGALTINLSDCIRPYSSPTKVYEGGIRPRVNLFRGTKVRGWFPVIGRDEINERMPAVNYRILFII
jgi:hypothetical protein